MCKAGIALVFQGRIPIRRDAKYSATEEERPQCPIQVPDDMFVRTDHVWTLEQSRRSHILRIAVMMYLATSSRMPIGCISPLG